MKKIKLFSLLILLLSIVALISCDNEPYYKKKQRILKQAKENYSTLSVEQKQLAEDIFNNEYNLIIKDVPRKNRILVIEKRGGEVIPYIDINKGLKKDGYEITYNSNELEYLVAVKRSSKPNGKYTDGSIASDTETNIYVIDISNGRKYKIFTEYLKAPKSIQKSQSDNETHTYGARGIEGNKLENLIIDKVLK